MMVIEIKFYRYIYFGIKINMLILYRILYINGGGGFFVEVLIQNWYILFFLFDYFVCLGVVFWLDKNVCESCRINNGQLQCFYMFCLEML